MANPIVTITMTDGSVMKAELYPEVAPNTVNNFISLVKKGFYDGLVFHRVIRGFMIQGGDPQGTAGKPMLDVLLGEELYNIAVVVTRYFGGTLLGTGGLVRAYSKAVQEGLKNSILITKNHGVCLLVGTDYNGVGKLQYLFGQENLPILDSRYTDSVEFEVLVPKKEEERIKKAVTEATSGKASVTAEKELYYAILDKEVLTFED